MIVSLPPALPVEEGWSRWSGATELLLVDRYGQTGTTLAPTVVDDLAATAGGHPLSESMRANTPRIVGLVSALHR
jgi:hypothetical protein